MIIPIIIIAILALGGKQIRHLILQPYVERSPLYKQYLEKQKSCKSLQEARMISSQFNDASAKIRALGASHFSRAEHNKTQEIASSIFGSAKDSKISAVPLHYLKSEKEIEESGDDNFDD